MQEFRVGDNLYRTRQKLNARQQFHVARRLAPLIGKAISLVPLLNSISAGEALDPATLEALIEPLAVALGAISDADCDYVLDRCLSVVQRQSGGGNGSAAWADIWSERASRMMFDDIEMPAMMQIMTEVVRENLTGFFPTALPAATGFTMEAPQQSPLASNG